MADVHEVQEANDKAKFHRQTKTPNWNILFGICLLQVSQWALQVS